MSKIHGVLGVIVLTAACRDGDAELPGDGGASVEHDGSVSHEGEHDGSVSHEGEPDLPDLQLLPGVAGRLQSREGEVCLLSPEGDIRCARGGSSYLVQMGPFVAFSLGERHLCGLSDAGELRCWGAGSIDEDCSSQSSFECGQSIVPPGKYIAVAAGDTHTCALDDLGAIHCWGSPADNRLDAPEGTGFSHLAAHRGTMCAVRAGTEILCWGADGPSSHWANAEVVQLSIHRHTACWVTQDATLACDFLDVEVPSRTGFAQVVPFNFGLCGLRTTGRIECYGDEPAARVTPLRGPFVEIAAQREFVCGLKGDRELVCWGAEWGQGGDTERCSIDELNGILDDSPLVLEVSAQRELERSYSFDIRPFGRLELQTTKFPLEDGEQGELDNMLLAIGPAGDDPERLLCVPAGSGSTVTRHDDELVLDLKQVGDLGRCPGTPVSGELTLCSGGSICETSGGGSMDGVPNLSPTLVRMWGDADYAYWLGSDQLEIRARTEARIDTPTSITWALIITHADSPWGGRAYCAGPGSVKRTVGEWPDDYEQWVFSALSVLPDCKAGQGTLQGCIR